MDQGIHPKSNDLEKNESSTKHRKKNRQITDNHDYQLVL